MGYLSYKWFWIMLDGLFPPRCAGCGTSGVRWCQDCHTKAMRVMPPYCDICGNQQPEQGICYRCKANPPNITAVRSWAFFGGPLRKAVHRLKYQRDIGLGEVFAEPLVEVFGSFPWEIELIIPVPLGVARQKERGYNQSSLLARPVAYMMKIPYKPKALQRTRETRSQVDLTREQRKQNVAGAFQARREHVFGRNILVVDDVTTSGATLDSCAEALLRAGARIVYGLTLARAE